MWQAELSLLPLHLYVPVSPGLYEHYISTELGSPMWSQMQFSGDCPIHLGSWLSKQFNGWYFA